MHTHTRAHIAHALHTHAHPQRFGLIWTDLFWNVFKRVWVIYGVADQHNVRVWVGKRAQAIVVFLPRGILTHTHARTHTHTPASACAVLQAGAFQNSTHPNEQLSECAGGQGKGTKAVTAVSTWQPFVARPHIHAHEALQRGLTAMHRRVAAGTKTPAY